MTDTITAIKKAEHERIWLEPHPGVELDGRMWCQDNQWGEDGVEYVLASTLESLQREKDARRVALEDAASYHDHMAAHHAANHKHVVSDYHEMLEKTHLKSASDIRALQSEER